MTPLLPQLSKGVGRRKLIELLPIHSLAILFSQALVLFSSSLLFLHPKNYTWAGWHRRPFLLYLFQWFHACSISRKILKNHFYEFLVCPYTWPVVETGVGRSSYPKSFSLVFDQMEKNILREKFIFWNFRGLFVSPPPFYVQNFTFSTYFSATI